MTATRPDPWTDALAAARLLMIDREGLKGAIVRAQPGAARDAWLDALRACAPQDAPLRRAPAHIDDERLLGGLDLAATLAAGRPVASRGLLAESAGGIVLLAMAERCPAATGARIAQAMDGAHPRFVLVALDEGLEAEERAPDILAERVAFHVDLDGVRAHAAPQMGDDDIRLAQVRLAHMPPANEALIESICAAAAAFGVGSNRAALFTLRAARAAAVAAGRDTVEERDLALAARLVLAPRARVAPAEPEAQAPPPDDDPAQTPEASANAESAADRLVEAVQSALPADFLAQFLEARAERRVEARSRGAGAAARSARRGRPLGARAGTLRTGDRLDLVATLRAAAPWQPLRRRESDVEARVLVRREDFRVRRFVQRLESTTIVVVDASGSAALQRLAEAKGAVETLLADAYVSRARVALIAFRNTSAELLLPPTRSLSRAKRSLAALPGGGATPLATAIDHAALLAQSERAKGRTPLIVMLTDGRGNVGRDGEAGRAGAESDALAAARVVRAAGFASVFIDTSPRRRPGAEDIAREMGAAYAPLPFVNAGAVADVVRIHAPTRR